MIVFNLEMFLELKSKGCIDSNLNLILNGRIVGKVAVGG
jgi:hypothetical protein